MKIKIVGNWELLLRPETRAEERILEQTNALGHVHFVCKAMMREKGQKRTALLLTPSLIRWQGPPEPKQRKRQGFARAQEPRHCQCAGVDAQGSATERPTSGCTAPKGTDVKLDPHDVQQGFVRAKGEPVMLVAHHADGAVVQLGTWGLPGGLIDNYKVQEEIGWHAMLSLKRGVTKVEIVIGTPSVGEQSSASADTTGVVK